MKVPTDNIFQLIHAMTASEKRYFKRHFASDTGAMTELFDYLNNQKSYNENQVKEYFKKSKISTHLKVYKVQLAELLLKSLTSYHNKKSIRSKIRIGLEEIELLMTKQLYGLAHTRIKKVKELCLKYEELEYIFSVLFFEIMINSFFDIQLKPSEYPVLEELEKYTDSIKNVYKLKKINFALHDKSNNEQTQKLTPDEQAYYTKILMEEEKKDEQGKLTFNEKYYLNSSLSLISKLVNDNPNKEYSFKKKNVELFETNPHFIENHTSYYYAALFNFLICCRKIGKNDELIRGIQKIKELTTDYPFLKRNLIFVYYLEIKYNYQKKNYAYLTNNLESVVNKHIKKYNQKEDTMPALCFIYFTLTYMLIDKPQNVQYYLRRLQAISKNLNPSYAQFFDILELISHYETGDVSVIQNLLGSFKRKIKKDKELKPFYKEMLEFFGDLIKITNAKERMQLVESFNNKPEQFKDDGVFNLLKVFLLDEWMDSVRTNTSYSDVIIKEK